MLIIGLCGCDGGDTPPVTDKETDKFPVCAMDNAGLTLPEGFCAGIIADSLGFIRHLAVRENGDIYVTQRNNRLNLGGIVALRDVDGDGKMDQIEKFSETPGMGIAISGNELYFASDTHVYHYNLLPGQLLPRQPPRVIVRDLPEQALHAGKPFAIGQDNKLYINIGATTNACQADENTVNGPGLDPCLELENHAGIWRFELGQLNQTQAGEGYRFASGIRNAYAIGWHPLFDRLYVVQHGRDQLHGLWPEVFTAENSARLPAEEFFQVNEGEIFSWPYCYYDPVLDKRVLAPEYGGDGKTTGRCGQYAQPLIAFPAHYGPNDLVFYPAGQFPERYHQGAFIAFHGSYNRGDMEQVGYQVIFVPMRDGVPDGDWEIFADGFAGDGEVLVPEDAEYRPTGLAVGPDGSVYVSDSVQGRIWRIMYTGKRQ